LLDFVDPCSSQVFWMPSTPSKSFGVRLVYCFNQQVKSGLTG